MYMDKHLPYILAFADIQKIHVVLVTIAEQDIGYKFFFTEEEAEKALKEMKIK